MQDEETVDGQDAGVMEPRFYEDAFRCPHCQVYTHQEWWQVVANRRLAGGSRSSRKKRCQEYFKTL